MLSLKLILLLCFPTSLALWRELVCKYERGGCNSVWSQLLVYGWMQISANQRFVCFALFSQFSTSVSVFPYKQYNLWHGKIKRDGIEAWHIVQSDVLCDAKPCNLAYKYRRFGGNYYLYVPLVGSSWNLVPLSVLKIRWLVAELRDRDIIRLTHSERGQLFLCH